MKYLYHILRLFFRPKCKHRWALTKSYERNIIDDRKLIVGEITRQFLQCQKCGETKQKVFKVSDPW